MGGNIYMSITIDNQQLEEVLKSAKSCRMKQLESEFALWKEYKDLAEEKDRLLKSLEPQVRKSVWDVLQVQDDFNSLMVCKAQDYFYDQGFRDCLNVIGLFMGDTPLPKVAASEQKQE
jgi:hypothetical protein